MIEAISKSYVLPFPVERVYQAWVSSDTVIAPATAMDIDPVVGGHYRLIMDTPTYKGGNQGTFTRVSPNQRLTYSWEWDNDGEVTEIDVVFSAHQDGTSVHVSHTGFTKEESQRNHDSGWDSYIAGFIEHLAGKPAA